MRRTMQTLVVMGFIATGLILVQTRVWAHADYERSEPARDAVLSEAPERVDVWFTQDVFRRAGQYYVRVFDPQDAQVSEGDGTIDDDDRKHIFTALPSGLQDGRYIVRWMATSDVDGHADDGAFCFYLRVEPTAEQEAECAAFAEGDTTPVAAVTATEPAATPTESAATPTEPAATETPAAPADGDVDDDGGTSTAVIVAGAVVGGVMLIAIVVAVAVWLRRTLA